MKGYIIALYKKYLIYMDNSIKSGNKSNIIFYTLLALLLAVSIGFTYYKIVILKNYQIVAQVFCDPATEKCFKTICDLATDNTCSATSSPTYYKNISKKASTIYACESTAEKIGCKDELICTVGESDCSYTFCNPLKLASGEECSN